MVVTRFAPSPTGHLHKGHAYAALQAWRFAQENRGRFLLRIEDIDHTRCSAENTDQIYEDLAWLGIEWETPVRIQSEHLGDYKEAAKALRESGFLYPCFCTRKDIQRELEAAGRAPHAGESHLYPGTCRDLSAEEQQARIDSGKDFSLRIHLARALESIERELTWEDSLHGVQKAKPELLGDTILARKDIATSYHLAVVHDDALQGVTHIVRGEDLFESTHLHRVLQELLGYPVPVYKHHALLTDKHGNRLAKRDKAITLKSLREFGISAQQLIDEIFE